MYSEKRAYTILTKEYVPHKYFSACVLKLLHKAFAPNKYIGRPIIKNFLFDQLLFFQRTVTTVSGVFRPKKNAHQSK